LDVDSTVDFIGGMFNRISSLSTSGAIFSDTNAASSWRTVVVRINGTTFQGFFFFFFFFFFLVVMCLRNYFILLFFDPGISAVNSTLGVVGTLIGSPTSRLEILYSHFSANETGVGITGSTGGTTLGGAVYVEKADVVDVIKTTFKSISSVSSGGGLYLNASTVATIENCIFEGIISSATTGGAISIDVVTTNHTIDNCTFANITLLNESTNGGYIYAGYSSGEIHITNSVFSNAVVLYSLVLLCLFLLYIYVYIFFLV
jgi:hypothetical protein